MVRIFRVYLYRVRHWFLWLWRLEGSPGQRARGLAVGIFSGCLPLFGLQTLLGVVLANLIKGNHLLAVIATWISNPLTYIPLYLFNYQIGLLVLGEESHMNYLGELNLKELVGLGWIVFRILILGSTLVGLVFGSLTGSIFYFLALHYKSKIKKI